MGLGPNEHFENKEGAEALTPEAAQVLQERGVSSLEALTPEVLAQIAKEVNELKSELLSLISERAKIEYGMTTAGKSPEDLEWLKSREDKSQELTVLIDPKQKKLKALKEIIYEHDKLPK